ncbi:ribosomal protein L7/L12 [Cyanobium sp. Morenito 9A2]|uniref:ribosomal protein L7/L12 n=1 Tax=Cyanobium sp. Morenito 9A2 TaxID=2823718 RepID=UPI0020CE59B1|nr:ribosomal protein L7/L12 [Cyanobium sp. Morenito 9A2]MCP9850375.1 ribosomal protein L7/L12 [Cyanobium sp. Morenito 9A2]
MTFPIPSDVQAAWDRGDRIGALRTLRERTGLGLKEAKEALESGAVAIRPGTAFLGTPLRRPLGTSLPAAVHAAIARGATIEAIKLTRQATGLGLKEAKEAVDAAARGAETGTSRRRSARHGVSGETPPQNLHWSELAQALALVMLVLLVVRRLLGP